MDIPALTHELEMLWQQVEALQRQAREAVGGQDTPLIEALAQLATALRTLRTIQEARHQAHAVAAVQAKAQRQHLTDANTRLRAEIMARHQELVRAGRALTAAWAARRRAEEAHAALTQQLQVSADQLAITGEQLQARTTELLMAHQEIDALHAELLAMNAELLAFNMEMMAQVTRETGLSAT